MLAGVEGYAPLPEPLPAPPPAEATPHGVWRMSPAPRGAPGHHLPWVQDGTGVRRQLPPPGSALPDGWRAPEAGQVHYTHPIFPRQAGPPAHNAMQL